MKTRQFIALMGTIAMLAVTGCTSPKFSSVSSIPDGKALVYIYRNAALGGIASSSNIFANGQRVASLYSGSYYPYFATPGTNLFSTTLVSPSGEMDLIMNEIYKGRVCLLVTEAGKTYYVQYRIATTWGPRIGEVAADKGEREIAKCRLAE